MAEKGIKLPVKQEDKKPFKLTVKQPEELPKVEPAPATDPSCGTCKHSETVNDHWAHCRYLPPTQMNDMGYAKFPLMNRTDDWCSQWQ